VHETEDLAAPDAERARSRLELAASAHDGELQLGHRARLVVAAE
jgi:hypothetical protein